MRETALKQSKPVRRKSGVAGELARVILRVLLWFAGITAVFILVGVGYAFLTTKRHRTMDVGAIGSIPAWFQHLSTAQWIELAAGVAVAVLLLALPSFSITVRRDPEKPASPALVIVKRVAVLAVMLLYGVGVKAAYDVSRALGHSRDWAIIHGVYSWVYVGFSFFGWMGDHRTQPLWKSVRQFLTMV